MIMTVINKILLKIKNSLKHTNAISSDVKIPFNTIIKGSTLKGRINLSENIVLNSSYLSGQINLGVDTTIKNSSINGNINIGKNNKIYGASIFGKLKTGNFTSFWGPNINVQSIDEALIEIGSFCSIARNVSFQSFNHNFKKPTSFYIGKNFFKENWNNEIVYKGNIILENDVWIGAHSVILGGIKIENGAVVAANSVVTKDVPAYAIVAGSPAKIIGYRFEPNIIKKLQDLAWWNWSSEKIKLNKSFFENELNETVLNNIIDE